MRRHPPRGVAAYAAGPWVDTHVYRRRVPAGRPRRPHLESRSDGTTGDVDFSPRPGRRGSRSIARMAALLVLLMLSLLAPQAALAQENGVIDGVVRNGTAGAQPPADVEVVLHVLQNRVKTGEHRVRTDSAGQFRVDGLTTGADFLYFPIVQYGGVAYYPDRPVVLDGTAPGRTEIAVYEGTPRADAVSFDRLNMLIMGVSPTALSIMEMGAVANSTDRTFVADPQVTGSARTLRFLLPPGAIDVTPQAGLPADSLESTPDGFASTDPVRPGRREIAFSYDLPYASSTVDLARSFAFPVGAFTLYVPSDVGAVVPDGIALPGTADLGGRQYRQYVVQQVAPGTPIRLRLTNLPAPLFARPRDLGLAVVGATGAVLLAFLLTAVGRRRTEAPTPAVGLPVDSPGAVPSIAERQALVRAVAQLDERFEAGGIDEAAYRAERAARKARLLALTRSSAGAS